MILSLNPTAWRLYVVACSGSTFGLRYLKAVRAAWYEKQGPARDQVARLPPGAPIRRTFKSRFIHEKRTLSLWQRQKV